MHEALIDTIADESGYQLQTVVKKTGTRIYRTKGHRSDFNTVMVTEKEVGLVYGHGDLLRLEEYLYEKFAS